MKYKKPVTYKCKQCEKVFIAHKDTYINVCYKGESMAKYCSYICVYKRIKLRMECKLKNDN